MRILLVEDGEFTRRVTAGAFSGISADIDYAQTVDDACIKAKKGYDMILLSSNLDYQHIVHRIRLNETRRNFIVLTVFDKANCYETIGIDMICGKPLNNKDIKHIIDIKVKNEKSIFCKAGFTTFKLNYASNSAVNCRGTVSTSDVVPMWELDSNL